MKLFMMMLVATAVVVGGLAGSTSAAPPRRTAGPGKAAAATRKGNELPELKTSPQWEFIPEDEDFPTADVIVSTMQVTDSRLRNALPADPATEDCTATFQEAIDQVAAAGGGTVFIPAGEYLFRGSLNLRAQVTLRGRWQAPSASGWKPGTVLKVIPKDAAEDGPPFLTLGSMTGIQELTFWYPEQKPDAIKPYPFTIFSSAGTNTVQDITLVNAYRGLNAQNAAMSVFRGIYGSPLETGMIAGKGVAFPRIEVINFGPECWSWWPLDKARPDNGKAGNYAHLMLTKGTAFRLRQMDGFNWFHADISGYRCGLVTEDDDGTGNDEASAPHGSGFRVQIHDCHTALQLRRAKIIWHESLFQGTRTAVAGQEHGSVVFDHCQIRGGTDAVNLTDTCAGNIKMVNCEVEGRVIAKGRSNVTLQGCDFASVPTLDISGGARGSFIGCRQNGRPLTVKAGKNITFDDHRSPSVPLPEYGLDYRKDWNRVRKPAKPTLFNVTDRRFAGGAKGDQRTDDTAAIKAAITAANQNGGGIVFLPTGYYRVTGNLDLGKGVELRGAAGSRYNAGGGLGGWLHLMSVIMVEAGEGRDDAPPFITLGDGSGVRHLLMFYPKQNWKRLLVDKKGPEKFPFTICGEGKGNYVISVSAPNPYQFVDFNGAEDFFVEFCLTGGLRTVYRVRNGAKNGRIQTGHIKPSGFMGILTDIPDNGPNRHEYGDYSSPMLTAFDLKDCSNITLCGIFARTAHRILTVNNASGRAVMIGGEELQNGFVFEKEAAQPFDLIGCDMNAGRHGDKTGKHVLLLGDQFKGSVRCFGGQFGGTADYTYRVLSGALTVYDADTPNYGWRAPRAIDVARGGELNLIRSGITNEWSLSVAAGGALTLDDCNFPDGFPVGNVQGKVSQRAVVSSGEMLLCAPGQFQFDEQGMKLDRTGTERTDQGRSWAQQLTTGKSFQVDVTDPTFINGKAGTVQITFEVYAEANGKVAITYDGKSGPVRAKMKGNTTVHSLNKEGFQHVTATVADARFGSPNADIMLELVEGSSDKVKLGLSMVCVKKVSPSRQLP